MEQTDEMAMLTLMDALSAADESGIPHDLSLRIPTPTPTPEVRRVTPVPPEYIHPSLIRNHVELSNKTMVELKRLGYIAIYNEVKQLYETEHESCSSSFFDEDKSPNWLLCWCDTPQGEHFWGNVDQGSMSFAFEEIPRLFEVASSFINGISIVSNGLMK